MPAKQSEEDTTPASSVYLAGLISFLLGGLLAVLSLIFQPAREETRLPKPEDIVPGEVIFLKGREGRDLLWQGKWGSIQSGLVVPMTLDESDLNAWARSSLAKMKKPENPGLTTVEPSRVNFRVTKDQQLQVGISFKLPGFSGGRDYILQLVGTPVIGPDGVGLFVTSGNLGSAPLGKVPVVRDLLAGQAMKLLLAMTQTTFEGPVPVPGGVLIADNQILLSVAE